MTIKSLRWLWVPAYIRTVSPYSLLILRSLWTWYFFSLVFLGSEKYPYKGILDLFANRGFADGTNAWTDIDYTCYTLSTAGEQGFLQLLPIYVDHILFPTITNARYVVEFSSSALFSQFNPVFWQRLVIEVNGPCSIGWDIRSLISVRYITLIPKAKMLVSCIVKCKEERIHQTIWCRTGPLLLHIYWYASFTVGIVH